MKAGGPPENLMVPYLLGELSEQDQTMFEHACLNDDQLFEELLAVEAELADDYVRGDLVGVRRAAFERRLLHSPEGAKQIALAKLITRTGRSQIKAVARTVPTERRVNWWSSGWFAGPAQFVPVGAAVILVIGISLGLLWWNKQPPLSSGTMAQAPQQQKAAGNEPAMSARAAKQSVQSNSPLVIATYVITAGGERDAGSVNEVRIPPGTDRVRFQVDVAAARHTSYRASLQKIGDRGSSNLAEMQASPSAAGKKLTIELPAGDLPAGDSILTVTGTRANQASPDVIGKYFVRRIR